ncbi:hypothetical protein ACUNV4_16815 [Granulosicoccus sp. 3-233]|uniref:hypothetical protein n=1 Tax=Granulosicoccus sp. 3-233 TaxID=3417969 RepID=UPI003D327609
MSLAFFVSIQPLWADSNRHERASPSVIAATAELLESSGMSEQLQSLPTAVIASFEQSIRSGGLDLPFVEQDIPYLKSTLSSAFNSERLQHAVQEQLYAELDEQQLGNLLRFYRSAPGREIREAEISNSILLHRERFTLWHQSSGLRSLTEARQLAIQALERALQASEAAVDTLISMQVALQLGLTPALPVEQRRSARQLIDTAQAQRPVLTRAYQESSLETIAFLYQQQSLDTLRAFTDILETDAGQRYVQAVNRGLSHGMLDAAETLGKSMQSLLIRRLGQGV